MFNQEQISRIIKKLVERSKKYEVLSINHVSKYILKQKAENLGEILNFLQTNPLLGTKWVMSAATARAGGERARYGEIICRALENVSVNLNGFQKAVRDKNITQRVYKEFREICAKRGKKPNEKINKGLIFDFLKCVQAHPSNNLFVWLKQSLKNNGIESTYLELLKIHGINKKITGFILRDIVWLLKLEKHVPFEHLIYLQPIDTWLKQISLKLWKDLHEKVDEFIIAKRIVERCSQLGVSSVSFNQGAWYFGSQEVKKRRLLEKYITELIT